MVDSDALLDALADPTRRAVLETLRTGPRSVADLAAGLPVSRPAVSQHLRVLGDAGFVTHERRGTRNFYRLAPSGLVELRRWVEALWDDALASFADIVEAPGIVEAPDAGGVASDG